MKKTWLIIVGIIAVLSAMGVAQFVFPRTAVSPSPAVFESSSVGSTTVSSLNVKEVTVSPSTQVVPPVLPSIAKGEVIAEWIFRGAYADNPELIKKAEAEVVRLAGLLGKGTYPDVSLYVAIANQYELLGDGKQQYDYLSRAIKTGGITGLPWHNLGVLMERLGATETARIAYEKSTLIQPQMKLYHYAYFEFLTTRMKNDVADIEKEYTAALSNLGQDTDILQLYSEWKQL